MLSTKTELKTSDAFLLIGVAFVCLLQVCTPPGVRAFAPPPRGSTRGVDPAVALARVCVKEAGFNSPDDCAGIVSVLERVGRGNVIRGAIQYSPSVFDASRLRSRPWIADLNAQGNRPRAWAGPSWDSVRPQWLSMIERARGLLAGRLAKCSAHHWGDQFGDRERATRAGWEELDCGNTRNSFWLVPSLTDRE